jgi:hypothetical protein
MNWNIKLFYFHHVAAENVLLFRPLYPRGGVMLKWRWFWSGSVSGPHWWCPTWLVSRLQASSACLSAPSHRGVRISEKVIHISVIRHGFSSNVFRRFRYKSCCVPVLRKFLINLERRSNYFSGRLYGWWIFRRVTQNCEKRQLASSGLYVSHDLSAWNN